MFTSALTLFYACYVLPMDEADASLRQKLNIVVAHGCKPAIGMQARLLQPLTLCSCPRAISHAEKEPPNLAVLTPGHAGYLTCLIAARRRPAFLLLAIARLGELSTLKGTL